MTCKKCLYKKRPKIIPPCSFCKADSLFEFGKKYTPPLIEQVDTMDFMYAAINKMPSKYTCRQCSSCHGCR